MIERVTTATLPQAAALADKLWPGHAPGALRDELVQLLGRPDAALFLAVENSGAVGFAQCQLRHDYVEGTHTSPVGYLEGIFVEERARHRGLAARLLAACEAWARAQGCTEFASDCALENTASRHFHAALGFLEAGRIVCFTKPLCPPAGPAGTEEL